MLSDLEWPIALPIAMALGFLLVSTWPLLVGLSLLYGLYRLLWTWTVGRRGLPRQSSLNRRATVHRADRALLASALAATVMSAVTMLIESYWDQAASFSRPEQFAWLLLVSGTGAWAVLVASKLWEGRRRDPCFAASC